MELKNNELAQSYAELVKSNKTLANQVSKMQRESESRNFVVYNLDDTPEYHKNLLDNVLDILKKAQPDFNPNLLEDVRRLGYAQNNQGKRSTLLCFTSKRVKMTIFSKIIKNWKIKLNNWQRFNGSRNWKKKYFEKIKSKVSEHGISSKLQNNNITVGEKSYIIKQITEKYYDILKGDQNETPTNVSQLSADAEEYLDFTTPTTSSS